MFIIDYKDKAPIFEQIENQIIYFISIGVLKQDDKLPSIRSLANELNINSNTVAKVYNNLEIKGIIYSSYKRGYFIGNCEVKNVLVEKEIKNYQELVKKLYKLAVSKEELIKLIDDIYVGGR